MTSTTSDDIRILVLEDSSDDAELICKALDRAGFTAPVTVVDAREEYIRVLDELRPDLILADHVLPRFRNEDALRLARERHPDVPFILMSGAIGEEDAVEAIKQGATD